MKKITALFLSIIMVIASCFTVMANDNTDADKIATEVNLNELDTTQGFEQTEVILLDDGTTVTVVQKFEPKTNDNIMLFSVSQEHTASVGTWTSTVTHLYGSIEYQYDVSKSGSQWKISNARNLKTTAFLSKVTSKSLSIYRSTSTNSSPAELNCMVEYSVCDNQWVTICEDYISSDITINSDGVLTHTFH